MVRALEWVTPKRVIQLMTIVGVLLIAGVAGASGARAAEEDIADEIIFYRDIGMVRYYDMHSSGKVSKLLLSGEYSKGWSSITGLDLDGGGQDEVFFYRASDGAYRYYDIRPDGTLSELLSGGGGYSKGWTTVTAIDLDGDGKDEMLFYRATDGVYKYYDTKPNGTLATLIRGGTGYTTGWSSITAVDLDGDGQDEIFFYRPNGTFRFYDIRANGSLGSVIREGDNFSAGWDIITAIDLDNDAQDEMLFYDDAGIYRYYNVTANGALGSPILAGSDYAAGWTSIASINLHGDLPVERVARFTTYFNCCAPRVTNIRQIAAEVNGYVIRPGQTFSIDKVTGPRTSAGGYVPAPYLRDGQGYCCAVGGGVSQFGTTIHNAVFWGGYDVVDHSPHSGWISRYPLGIEATLVYSSIDYKFTNDTVTPITIRTYSTSTSVTVELWGNQGGWRMNGYHPTGSRSSRITVLDQGGPEAKRVSARVTGSAPGLVRIDRTLRQGGSSKTETWWWRYVS